MQEKMQCMAMGSMPRSIKVILVDDLADGCKSGGVYCMQKAAKAYLVSNLSAF